jgi:hypothetical protein
MNRALLLALLSLFVSFSPNATTKAGSIVYEIQNYAALQNGYTLSGTITTDGTIGTLTSTGRGNASQRRDGDCRRDNHGPERPGL